MPEMVPIWEQLVELAGGGDLAARFLSLYRPPAYLTGCSQAIWPGQEPVLVRNYDYSPRAFEGLLFRSGWRGAGVMGMSDCLIGLLDGINESGLAVSLAFGGTRTVGDGFGVPIILRYVLQTCRTAEQAARVLARVPTHMAYNVTVLDRYKPGSRFVLHRIGKPPSPILRSQPIIRSRWIGTMRAPQHRSNGSAISFSFGPAATSRRQNSLGPF